MKKYWTSWWISEGVDPSKVVPFRYWITGYRERPDNGLTAEQLAEYQKLETEEEQDEYIDEHGSCETSICALITAADEEAVWDLVQKYFPDYQYRFIDEKPDDFELNERFK